VGQVDSVLTFNIPHQGFTVNRSKVARTETVDALPEGGSATLLDSP
jgi:hypothetical protein